jgi:hypothetical protein
MCCRQLPHHINIIYPCEVAKNHTTSHRHHFPYDVINSPITSPPITYVLPPITTSHRHHFLDDVVKNPITSFPDDVVKNPHMGNDVDVMWCGFWQPHMGK